MTQRKFPVHNARGITLIEIMVVMAIAAGIAITMMNAARSLDIFPSRSEVMSFSGAIKSAYDRSVLTGLRYDVVLDIDKGSYSLECTDQTSVVFRKVDESASERAFRHKKGDDQFAQNQENLGDRTRRRSTDDGPTPQSPNMKSCDDHIVPSHTFDRGLVIDRVQTSRMKSPVDEGQVRIAVFPNGTIEPAVIWISNKRKNWTLIVQEMTGKVEVLSGEERRVRDVFEVEED